MPSLFDNVNVLSPNSENNRNRVDHNDFDGDHHDSSWHHPRGHKGHGKDHGKGHGKGHGKRHC